MKHAGPAAIEQLADLLAELRHRAIVEKKPGVFYRRGRAFLHFHEDSAGLFADLRVVDLWDRFPVGDAAQRALLIKAVDRALGEVAPAR